MTLPLSADDGRRDLQPSPVRVSLVGPFRIPCPAAGSVLPGRVSVGDAARILQRHLGLTEAESEIAYLLPSGLTVKELALQTKREPTTVKGHLEHSFRKTRTANSRELAALVTAVLWWEAEHDGGSRR